jgi:DNA-binding NarL/FixJ family response regulator
MSYGARAMQVLIVEDHALVREGLRRVLDGDARFETCLECSNLHEALAAARGSERLGLVLLDVGLPDAPGAVALERFRDEFPAVPVLVISGSDDAAVIDAAFQRGARGYLPQSAAAPTLRAAVDTVLRGELYVPPCVLPSLAARGREAQVHLTQRQAAVLALVARGLSNKEVAQELDMSPATVRVHVSALLRALGVENRTQAATSAVAQRLLEARASSP